MKRALLLSIIGFAIGTGLAGLTPAARSASPHEPILIVNAMNSMSTIDRKSVVQFFLKKKSRWPNGELVLPADLGAGAEAREWFSERVLGRSISEVKNYWQQNIFSGHKVPPPEFDREEEVAAYVRDHPGAIGYVSDPSKAGGNKILSLQE